MKVPFLDLAKVHAGLRPALDAAIAAVLDASTFVGGSFVEDFEAAFARHVGARHAVGVGNGLEALKLALEALGVGPGDEVLVPSHTFIATWLAVTHCGATPVPVEPAEGSFHMDPARAAAALTPRTRAIVPVALYGSAAGLPDLLALASRHGLKVVVDAAQAHGATWAGAPMGLHGDAAAWSFYPGKNLGALGDGGAVTTNDPALAQRVQALRNYGSPRRYQHDCLGHNSRLDTLQAAVLSVKLPHLPAWNARRRVIAFRYLDGLAGVPGLGLPPEDPGSVWHLFVVRCAHRDALARRLADHGVQTQVHYPTACHLQPAYREAMRHHALPQAERLAAEVLSLPMGPHLSDAQVDHCLRAVRAAMAEPVLSA